MSGGVGRSMSTVVWIDHIQFTKISNLTITGGDAGTDDGGGIFCNHSHPSLENVEITGNAADKGGGMYDA